MKIIENALPRMVFNNVKYKINKTDFPWYFTKTAYDDNNLDENNPSSIPMTSWANVIFAPDDNEDMIKSSPWFYMFESIILTMLDKAQEPIEKIFRIRLGMITGQDSNYINPPHVDYPFPHKTALFYFNTTDGDTIFYNEKYDINSDMDSMTYYNQVLKKNMSVNERIPCEENKLIIFDGLTFHSSTTPTNVARRMVLNVNFL
jgi:hypothetical protein